MCLSGHTFNTERALRHLSVTVHWLSLFPVTCSSKVVLLNAFLCSSAILAGDLFS
jgi:hypothetical protein